jgi:sister-chromatid-cohesion protein PDS5
VATRIGGHEFEVIFELHHICPSILLGVWNQLEDFMLGSLDGLYNVDSSEKKAALSLLVHLFSEKDSDFAFKHRHLWNCFRHWYVPDVILNREV